MGGQRKPELLELNAMISSVMNLSECAKYDFGHFLFSPEFFLEDKVSNWNALDSKSENPTNHYFDLCKNTVNKIDETHVCYDLTDALSKFLDSGDRNGSNRKSEEDRSTRRFCDFKTAILLAGNGDRRRKQFKAAVFF